VHRRPWLWCQCLTWCHVQIFDERDIALSLKIDFWSFSWV
jgi:hypothetical protein